MLPPHVLSLDHLSGDGGPVSARLSVKRGQTILPEGRAVYVGLLGTNLLTAVEITAGVALYALPWIPSEQAQRMIHPSVTAHALESALTYRV
jgi:hypothetical protein